MFGIGLPELAVIFVVAVLVFGPDRLPEFARQAGRFVRQVRTFATSARDDIRSELGPDFADFELTDLDPRRAVRKYVRTPGTSPRTTTTTRDVRRPGQRPLETGELPPYDSDATGQRAQPTFESSLTLTSCCLPLRSTDEVDGLARLVAADRDDEVDPVACTRLPSILVTTSPCLQARRRRPECPPGRPTPSRRRSWPVFTLAPMTG